MPSSRTILFTKEFKKNIKSLAKQYRKIKSDLLPVITTLESGDLLGDQIKGVPYKVYKARVPNTSASKGKQGTKRFCQPFSCILIVATGMILAPLGAHAITSHWIVQDANGTWNNPANWDNGVPKSPGDIAIITNTVAPTASRTITIDTDVSLKALKFAIPMTGLSPAFLVELGTGGSLTMDSGNGSSSLIIQMPGSARCKITAPTTLSNDVDIINSVGASTYFDVANPISGNFNLHINTDGSTAQPYMTVDNTFIGNTTIYSGKVLFSRDFFGNTASGTRVVTLFSNAVLRVNFGASGKVTTLAANRQLVVGDGGGVLDGNGRIVALNAADQFAGTNTFTLRNQNNGVGGLYLGAANNGFAGSLIVDLLQTIRLGPAASISNAPLINLLNASARLDVQEKPEGYTIPPNQVLAGIGSVTGRVTVANAATLHPGSYALPGPVTSPGILTFTDGGLSFAEGGTYAWGLKQLKDNAYSPGTTTYSTINVMDGDVSINGGSLSISFLNGIAEPDSADPFWQTSHRWTILTAASPPTGILTVTNGIYTDWAFTTQVNGNTLELVYGAYTPAPQGTIILLQ